MSSITEIKNFVKFAARYLSLNSMPQVKFVGSAEDKKATFGHFDGKTITVRATNRHPIDVMRTVAHELIHHKQRLMGSHSREGAKEDEANALAGRIMKAYDTKYPHMFKAKPIYEDTGAVTTTLVGAGTGDNPDPTKPLAQPLFKGKGKKLKDILTRKPVKEAHIFHKKTLFPDAGLNSLLHDRNKLKKKINFSHSAIKKEDNKEKKDYTMRKSGGNSKKTILPVGD
mgnify:FL=1|jgi:hypothetical protein